MEKLPWIYLVVALSLVYLPRLVVAREQAKMPEGYDNAHPRDQQAKLGALGRRAQGAHNNGFEAFAPFAAGILASMIAHVPIKTIAIAGGIHVVARAIYIALYLGDKPTARSTVWSVAFFATSALLVLPIFQ
ncbi:MAG: MAPEG family protein [Polyangiales bacterium]